MGSFTPTSSPSSIVEMSRFHPYHQGNNSNHSLPTAKQQCYHKPKVATPEGKKALGNRWVGVARALKSATECAFSSGEDRGVQAGDADNTSVRDQRTTPCGRRLCTTPKCSSINRILRTRAAERAAEELAGILYAQRREDDSGTQSQQE